MVVNTQGMEIDSFTKQTGDKDGSPETGFPQAKTPKHCNKGTSRIQGPGAQPFQPQAYPGYAQGQTSYRPPGLYNPVRGQNGAPYYGAPTSVMVSPGGGGYMRPHTSYYHTNGGGGGGDYDRGAGAAGGGGGFNPYQQHHRYHHPMYGADIHSRQQSYDNHPSAAHPSQTGMDFSRAVSSSFGESNTSKQDSKKESSDSLPQFNSYYKQQDDDNKSIASKADSDTSWKLLNQVASIEEEKFRIAEAGRLGATSPIDENKSVEGKKYAALPSPSKMAPLTSLASVSSVQEPLDTSNSRDELDLIQCASSGSLLFNTNDDSFPKRPREERGDAEGDMRGIGDDEIRRAPSNSPPNVANLSMKDNEGSRPPKKRRGSVTSQKEDYYDQPPSYSFSLESASSFSKEQVGTLPLVADRSRSSVYSIHDRRDSGRDDMLASSSLLWEIKGQDSFGGALSVGSNMSVHAGEGPVITSSFSFGKESGDDSKLPEYGRSHDIHSKITKSSGHRSNANEIGAKSHIKSGNNDANSITSNRLPPGKYPPHAPSWVTNTSSFSRDSRASGLYGGGHPQGPVRSYSTASAPPGPAGRLHPGQKAHNEMMRNYSQDNGRASPATSGHMGPIPRYGPLHGPYGTALPPHIPPSDAHLPPNFRPPHPGMQAHPHMGRRPPPSAVFIMTSPPGGRPGIPRHASSDSSVMGKVAGGVYSWTKQDDSRLTDIMKKFKNPKDWEPIAKAFGRGKTPKECHERWIRYLKPGVRKGQWQDHEDAIVVEAVTTSKEQPFTRWSDLAQRLPGRVGKQIRDRWVNHLNPNINHMPFTREDDLLLWEGHKKLGKRWVEISSKYFNSSRSENHIKNRWYSASFKKFIANEFGPDAYSGGKKKDGKGSSKSSSSKG